MKTVTPCIAAFLNKIGIKYVKEKKKEEKKKEEEEKNWLKRKAPSSLPLSSSSLLMNTPDVTDCNYKTISTDQRIMVIGTWY